MAGVSSSDDFIDARDVTMEADQLESEIEDKKEEITLKTQEIENADEEDDQADLQSELDDLADDLTELESDAESIIALRDELDLYPEPTLINESHWTAYVEQLAEDIDGIDTSAWPFNCIDWDQAAEQLSMDFSIITFEGTDFYIRS